MAVADIVQVDLRQPTHPVLGACEDGGQTSFIAHKGTWPGGAGGGDGVHLKTQSPSHRRRGRWIMGGVTVMALLAASYSGSSGSGSGGGAAAAGSAQAQAPGGLY
jgi:hypothetical protein